MTRDADVDRFNWRCRVAALLGLTLLTVVGLRLRFGQYDFPQYYAGAMVAREGAWDLLYPIPNPDSPHNPGMNEDSVNRPGFDAVRARFGATDGPRFIHSPPMALFLAPLAFLKPSHAHLLWIAIQILCAWGVAILAGRFYETLATAPSRVPGWLALGAACCPLTLFNVRIANLIPITALCLGYATLELLRRDGARGGFALFGATLTKYAGPVLLPLHVLRRQWRTVAWFVLAIVAVSAIALLVEGTGPFKIFISEIAPRLGRSFSQSGNHSLTGVLLRITQTEILPPPFAIPLAIARAVVGCFVLLMIYRRRRELDRPEYLFPAAAALITWMLIFAPIHWYQLYLIPFWGWVVWEMRSPNWTIRLLGIITIALGCLSVSMAPPIRLPEPLASYGLLATIAMFLLAIRRLRIAV